MGSKFELKKFKNCKMYLIKNDRGISRTLFKGQKSFDRRELAFMSILRSSIKKGDICADLGANIGFVTLQMADLAGKDGHVFAIEPDKININVLKMNRKVNNYEDRITIDRAAISDECGEVSFYISDKSNLGALTKNPHCSGKTVKVKMITVDDYFKDKQLPDFYKMDVEGHEVGILDGMHETAKRSKSGTKILMEVHPQFYSKKYNMERSLNSMVDFGFMFRYVITAGVLVPDKFKERGYTKPDITYKNFSRAVYENMKTSDAIYFCSKPHRQWMDSKGKYSPKIVRAIMLEKR
jgi:FkbM family methyltransferase